MTDMNERAKEAVDQATGGKFRHQPVTLRTLGGEIFLTEVYFDSAGKLQFWSGYPPQPLEGNDLADLKAELINRLVDTVRWAPVAYEDLHVGMEFTPLLTEKAEAYLRSELMLHAGLKG